MRKLLTDMRPWSSLMGRDLGKSDLQPLQAVRINKNGAITINVKTGDALGFSPGDKVGMELRSAQCLLQKDVEGSVAFKPGKPINLPVSAEIGNILFAPGSITALLIGRQGEGVILPVIVKEHPPDLLGPRFIDELREDCVVRHSVPGLSRDGWTSESLCELEEMLCSEPISNDPVSVIAQGEDWVGWMTRNRILKQSTSEDDRLGANLVEDIFREQRTDGSWHTVSATSYAILRLLTLGESPSDKRLQRAAKWLLQLPEPSPRPGMWMLTEEYRQEWLSRRQPKEHRVFTSGEIQRTPPDDSINFYSWNFPMREQDQFRGQEMQQVIPICARHHPPACEPRITHISALVAEVLMRCGYSNHPRLRRYVNTVFHLGGQWGYWCGCGALGLYDSDIPVSEDKPDFNIRVVADDGTCDMSTWRWISEASESSLLANQPNLPDIGTHLEPFAWYRIPAEDSFFALLGTGWQNGDCWAKTNRALSQHPSCPGSLMEHLAIYQASRYQTSLGEWHQGFPAGLLNFLSLYNHETAKSLVIKTVPWLRQHQADDGLWHHEKLPQDDWGKLAVPPEPGLATYHVVQALHKFGLIERLRP